MKATFHFFNSDAKLYNLIKNGDESALVTLYQSNQRMITSYILRNSGTEDDAEDLLQEAVIIVWERIRSGRFEYSAQLSTFIFATVKNMWMRRLAKNRREIPTEIQDENVGSNEESAEEKMIDAERVNAVAIALQKIGEPCKTLLILFYWEECSTEEIAQRMKFANADTVKSKKYQCKKMLEKILRNFGSEL